LIIAPKLPRPTRRKRRRRKKRNVSEGWGRRKGTEEWKRDRFSTEKVNLVVTTRIVVVLPRLSSTGGGVDSMD